MELKDLENILSRAATKNLPGVQQIVLKKSISFDPFRGIKIRFMWILIFFAATTLIFSPFLFIPGQRNFLFEILYFILSVESLISLLGFLQIKNLEQKGINIKQTLIKRISGLRIIYKSYIFLNAVLYLVMAILIEVKMHSNGGFDSWEKISWPVRFTAYGLFITFQILQKNWSFQKNYGAYLSSMIHLLEETNGE
jgi:hypothetical protein